MFVSDFTQLIKFKDVCKDKPLIKSLFAAFCLLQIEVTVFFVANNQWNTLKTVCSGATRL